MEWHHMTCPMKTTFKSALLAATILSTILCDEKDVILVNFLPRETTVNSDCCNQTLKSLNVCLHQVHPTGKA
jgi:hypothetical protein